MIFPKKAQNRLRLQKTGKFFSNIIPLPEGRCVRGVGKSAKKFVKGVYKEGGSVENTASVLGRAQRAPQALDRGGRKA